MIINSFPEPTILLEDGPVIFAAKPGGLLTQGPPEIDSIALRLRRFLKVRDEKPGKVYLAVPHRLDRPVSGAMVFAKHVRAARKISEQFERRTVKKTYWAVVEGNVSEDEGTWKDTIRKVPDKAFAEITTSDQPGAKEAILNYKVKQRSSGMTWLEIQLETGRMHQIRLQAGSRGHAVLGDSTYGSTTAFGPDTPDIRARWIALHSRVLGLNHPMTREPIEITCPLSEWWLPLPLTDLPKD